MNYYNVDHNLMAGGRRILPDGPLPNARKLGDPITVQMDLGFNVTAPNQQQQQPTISPCFDDGDSAAFQAVPRSRAYTWNGRMLTPNSVVLDDILLTPPPIDGGIKQEFCDDSAVSATGKKAGAHRNAWGSLSYADLITKAIESSPSQRLTLAQIYAWMVDNVPFFSDKGDTNSSAGWKNSIRHNLSLHNLFVRVPNEGAGKSSWWVLNTEARPVRAPRRRAATMDSKNLRRGTSRRSNASSSATNGSQQDKLHSPQAEQKRISGSHSSMSSDQPFTSSISPTLLAASPIFRARSSSNASNISRHGRLSPIQAEPDVDANVFMDTTETDYFAKPDGRGDVHRGLFRVGNSGNVNESSASTLLDANGLTAILNNRRNVGVEGISDSSYAPSFVLDQYQLNQFQPNFVGGIQDNMLVDNSKESNGDYYGDSFSLESPRRVVNRQNLMQQSQQLPQQIKIEPQELQSGILKQQLNIQQFAKQNSKTQQSGTQQQSLSLQSEMTQQSSAQQASSQQQSDVQQRHLCLQRLLGDPQPQQTLNLFRDRQAFLQLMAERPHLKVKLQQLLAQRFQKRDAQPLQESQQQKQPQQIQQSSQLPNGQPALANGQTPNAENLSTMNKIDVLKQLLTGGNVTHAAASTPSVSHNTNGVVIKTEKNLNVTADGDADWTVNFDVDWGSASGESASSNNSILPFDFDADFRPSSDIECDINEVINYDSLYFDDSFDFAALNVDATTSNREFEDLGYIGD